MSYFRWRQLPTAQEQMHTGLLLPDGTDDQAAHEVRQLHDDLQLLYRETDLQESSLTGAPMTLASVALVFDYSGDQMQRIQPQGDNYDPLGWVQAIYTALRRSGVDVDIVCQSDDLSSYKLVVLANVMAVESPLLQQLSKFKGHVVIGPRCGSKTVEHAIPPALPPGDLQTLLPVRITRVESLPDFVNLSASDGSVAVRWREKIDSSLTPAATFEDGWGFYYRHENRHYLNSCLDADSLLRFIRERLDDALIDVVPCDEGLRLRRHGALQFAFNFGPSTVRLEQEQFLIGQAELGPADVAVWRVEE